MPLELLQDSELVTKTIAPHWSSSYPGYLSPDQDEGEQRRIVWSRLHDHRANLANRLARTRDRYLEARRALNPRTTQVESSHDPLYRDNRFFNELTKLVEEFDVPAENIYNMDEKGCQRGGGKKSSRRKYVYSKKQQARYKQRSANLELITVLETVCADGDTLKPCFVFPGTSFCPEWFDSDPEVV